MHSSRLKTIFSKLYFQILLGIVAGVIVGYLDPKLGVELKPLGDLFIKLIRMLLAPIIKARRDQCGSSNNDRHRD